MTSRTSLQTILSAIVLGTVIPMVLTKKDGHLPLGKYGAAGGAVCPRCTFPVPRSVLSPNMVVGKLVRCPHCGKWAILPVATHDALVAAEERYLASQEESTTMELDEEKSLKSALDDSRFED
ncbi:MAG: hypothetical protein ACK2T7_07720 [Anaerolineales bacterium]